MEKQNHKPLSHSEKNSPVRHSIQESADASATANKINRRSFIATAGMAGAALVTGSLLNTLGGSKVLAETNDDQPFSSLQSANADDIDYRYSLTHTERTVGEKLRETISVKDFGAVGDGVANDTPAIQSAIDQAIQTGRSEIFFPDGTYNDSSSLTNAASVTFVGDAVSFVSGNYETVSLSKHRELLNKYERMLLNSRDTYFSNFDYQTLVAQSVTTIHDGAGSRFPQAAVIDNENGKFYITRQTSGNYQDQMIYEYDMVTQNLLRSQPVPIGIRVYIEGLVFFRNSSNQLCFIVPVERYGKFGIFNFDTGVMQSQFNMPGNFKIGVDNNLKYFLCGKNANPNQDPNTDMNGIYIYDLESVKAGSPVLAGTVDFIHEQMFNHKIQGLTMIEDYILLGQGVQNCYISVLDLNGDLIYMASYDSKEVISLFGGDPDSSNLQVESEGVSWVKENGVTYPVHLIASQSKASLLKLGDTQSGIRISHQLFRGYNPFREHAAFHLIQADGTPTVYVTTGQDFYAQVAAINQKGIFTFFCNGSAANAPIGGRSTRGTIIVTELTSEGVAAIAEIRGQDFGGVVWSNYYDTRASQIWKGWSPLGGAHSVQAPATFNPFTANPGVYETSSATNAPVNNTAVKTYTITRGYGNRKQYQCHYSETGNVYFGSTHNNVFQGWRQVSLT